MTRRSLFWSSAISNKNKAGAKLLCGLAQEQLRILLICEYPSEIRVADGDESIEHRILEEYQSCTERFIDARCDYGHHNACGVGASLARALYFQIRLASEEMIRRGTFSFANEQISQGGSGTV